MGKTHSTCLIMLLAAVFGLILAGCNSQSGQGKADPEAPLVEQFYSELCGLCHAPGRTADAALVHASDDTSNRKPEITGVTEATSETDTDVPAGEVRLKIAFRIMDSENPLIPVSVPANDIRFTIAKLVPVNDGGAGEGESRWMSYLNRTASGSGGPVLLATYERASQTGGTFVDNMDGSYSYIFSFNMMTVTDPVSGAPILYDRSMPHRVAMQVAGNVDNAVYDYVPDGSPAADTRYIAGNASCDECHIKLGFHGGGRIAVDYCVTCHNPGTTDPATGNTLNLGVMVHKIHMGENLPSVEAGGKYLLGDVDYSENAYPQDIRRCTKCHDGTPGAATETDDGNNWKKVPTMEMCTSCHDRTSFAAAPPAGFIPHSGGVQTDNSKCIVCHPDVDGIASVTDSHVIPETAATARFKYNIISIAGTAPGGFPAVTFSVTDPANGDLPYDILKDPEFTAPAGASRLAVLIGWETTDYTNTDSGSTPAQPISINPLAQGAATDNGDGTFTVKSTIAIPANAVGSGVMGIEGHPAVETTPGSGVYDLRVPVTSVVEYFPITDSAAEPRRDVVSINNCNKCHGALSLHGGNRTNQTQLCVICHNPDATDIARRPADTASAADGKAEEAIDFKSMIHAIHGAEIREKGIVIYGFGNSANDFSSVRLPSGVDNIRNCEGCHLSGTFEVPVADNVLPTTIETGADLGSPGDDTNVTPAASVCTSCHDGITAKTHAAGEGGKFDFVPFKAEDAGGGDADPCAPGPVSAQPPGHTPATDCCSCHG
ncbi:MAG: OmcA/MtrC family decaheme c-type cytochrome [Desulfosalsimonadaceae bacterium]|nr:OmcA/MtrC family decaheme c-type cytochrome [Desulfosalsimonadaceae bacterium]